MAAAAGWIFQRYRESVQQRALAPRLISGGVAECIMVAGYFGFEAVLLGMGLGAAANIPFNLAQGVVGVASATAVMSLLNRVPGLPVQRP